MAEIRLFVFFSVFLFSFCNGSDVFHEGSKLKFYPNYPAEFFGYSVAFSDTSIIVGAPKATTQGPKNISAGVVFSCSLQNLQTASVSCTPLKIKGQNTLKSGMWFGASLAVGPSGKLVICAPRWARVHEYGDGSKTKKIDVNGACYFKMKRRETFLFPLDYYGKQFFFMNNSRTEYIDYHLNADMTYIKYYSLAQAGMAVKVTEDRIIIGAPGLLAWSGGVVQYTYNPDETSISYSQKATYNPFFTHDVRPDEYFGYSVESGIFEDGGKTLYVVGGPRAKRGFGMVLVFEPATIEMAPLNILARLEGPQLGAYFGASLSCLDINADGRIDVLVGAPNYVKKFYKDDLYDQGAVIVYLNKEQETGFILDYAGRVSGSEVNGAKFGYSIANLGDIDGDGYNDVAISSPWENEGAGVVYIYGGDRNGLKRSYMQRIVASEVRGFGMGLTKGYDVDHNNCNDLVIGAYETGAVYMYRCLPTTKVQATIKVPGAFNLPQNTTNFTAEFCVNVLPLKDYKTKIKMEFNAMVTVDLKGKRAMIAENSIHSYKVSAAPSSDNCELKVIEIKPAADLSKPISIMFELQPIDRMLRKLSKKIVNIVYNPTQFKTDAGRVSKDSDLRSNLNIQLIKDCGTDLICTPCLKIDVLAINEDTFHMRFFEYRNRLLVPKINRRRPYIPGSEGRLGAIVTVMNEEEPAFGIRINLTLPSPPKRVPKTCILQGLNMTCNLPSPFYRNQTATWVVEFEYTNDMRDMGVTMIDVTIDDPVYNRNVTDNSSQYLEITIMPIANISVSGKALPNSTMSVSREILNEGSQIPLAHYFQVTNAGPSDWHELSATILVTGKVSLASKETAGCEESWDSGSLLLDCTWSVNAMQSMPIVLPLYYDFDANGKFLEANTTYIITSTLYLYQQNKSLTLTTTLIWEPAPELWIIMVVATVAGLLLLAVLSYVLYKCGFFSRVIPQESEQLLQNNEEPGCSSVCPDSGAVADEDLLRPSCSSDNGVDPSECGNAKLAGSAPTSISEATEIYVSLQKQLLVSHRDLTD